MTINSSGRSERSRSMPRRQVLRWMSSLGAASLAAPALSACGFSTTGGAGEDGLSFFTTQFGTIEEGERFRNVLSQAYHKRPVSVVAGDPTQLRSQITAQVRTGNVQIDLIGALHGDFATLGVENLEDISDLTRELAGRNYSDEFKKLATLGSGQAYYIPWAQATYVIAAHQEALEWLPAGANVDTLSYEQFLDWAVAARRANGGRPAFGLPGGPTGLFHRFIQGYLYPAFTGGQVTTFASDQAVRMWQYFRDLWANCATASTNYDFMQEPLLTGEVKVAWDHVVRLVDAPKQQPEQWRFAPPPAGPHGRAYMPVLLGLGVPKGAPNAAAARDVIRALSEPETQLRLMNQNSLFPTVEVKIGDDLAPEIRLEADAVRKTQEADDALLALLPVGLGAKDAQMSKVYRDAFTSIVLQNKDIKATLGEQAAVMQQLINEAQARCWPPDPASDDTCQVRR
ncbi:MAG: ABC transporter substrate-binding protein [Pseudonocardiaceae bacterium]